MSNKVKIRIGNQTAFSASTVMEPFEYAVTRGFDAFEWFPDKRDSGEGWTESDLSAETRVRIRDTAFVHDISLSVHTPWHLNPLRIEDRKRLSSLVEFAGHIGASLLNLHLFVSEGIAAYAEAIKWLMKRLQPHGIKLSIENTPVTRPEHFNELFKRLRDLSAPGSGNPGMCLDLGHANLYDGTRNDYLKYIDLLDSGVPIIHAHLHENYGDHDSHLPLFSGPAGMEAKGIEGFLERLRDRHFAGCMIFEQWPDPPSLLNEARDRLHRMILELTQPAIDHSDEDHVFPRDSKKEGVGIACSPGSVMCRQTSDVQNQATQKTRSIRDMGPFVAGSVSEPGGSIRKGRLPETGYEPCEEYEDDFARKLAEADSRRRSWREKLGWICDCLTDVRFELSLERLIYLAIYLRFIGTGEVCCEEDGQHYRPSHHAEMARRIHQRLAQITTPENVFLIRKIYPWLPSCDVAFTRADPLTRIRDIAHRDDIPQPLKREIKRTLQNKLHRCAGPEDLATSAALLNRVTSSQSNYPPAFVKQFKQFHEELKEFFNARSLEEQLQAMMGMGDANTNLLIEEFLEVKEKATTLQQQINTLKLLTELRGELQKRLGDASDSTAQKLQLADIRLEDFSFAHLSHLINHLNTAGDKIPWSFALHCVKLTLENLRFSGFETEECQALESELSMAHQNFENPDYHEAIRLKAILDRCQRLADAYCDRILAWLPEKVQRLGQALGVARETLKVFSEADIRSHLVFQLSKLCSLLLTPIRALAAFPPWTAIVPGKVSGWVASAPCLTVVADYFDEPTIVLLDRAEGDERMPAGVVGIIVAHAIPHLSHLALRARHGQVVFAVCEDREQFADLESCSGKWLSLNVSPVDVSWTVSSGPMEYGLGNRWRQTRLQQYQLPEVVPVSESMLIPLEQVTVFNGGGKANAARRLDELSRLVDGEFLTPQGLVIPYGVMEEALRSAPALKEEYGLLIHRLDETETSEIAPLLKRLQDLVEKLEVSDQIVHVLMKKFRQGERLIVRSSAYGEDLNGLAEAGLYDSVANVMISDVADAVRRVWASLWTKRAVTSRAMVGIPQEQARMAVLIQEMLSPELSFTMHTANPISNNAAEIYVELAVGLGESLGARATPGTPYRLVRDKNTGELRMLAFANFSKAVWPAASGGLTRRTVDYSRVNFSQDKGLRNRLGDRLHAIGRFVEDSLGGAQDIEGAIVGDDIYLVQSRPQQRI
ncbi:MAG: TIM barrel protein [Deltaproteobacteria bacterium]|nr:MAG: TIM barrel protein [Deltaproteobacteria bacterium]